MVSLKPMELGTTFLALWMLKTVIERAISLKRARSKMGDCPGRSFVWLHPFRSLALLLGPIFPLRGQMGYYYAKFSMYRHYGSTCLSSVTLWDAIPTFWLSDADAIKAANTERAIFQKDVEAYEALYIYGRNMVGTEGAEWKRHRSVAKNAFNEANNVFVWGETIRVANEWFSEVDSTRGEQNKDLQVDILTAFTQLTLLVISSAGFGRRVSWKEDTKAEPPPGHKMAFRRAVTSAIRYLIPKVLTPNWIYTVAEHVHIPYISPILNETLQSFEELRYHMLDVVSAARAWIAGGKATAMDAALLRNLVEANMIQEGDAEDRRLTDEELLSDTFLFLLAGHETSAHSLCFAALLLAFHPEIQQKVLEEVTKLWPTGAPTSPSDASYKDSMPRLEYTSAVFHETLRLFAPVARLAKNVETDTILKGRKFSKTTEGKIQNVEEFTFPVKAGSIVVLDVFGLHMNPIHWGDDAEEFKPERFIDTDTYRWPRDAFLAFSSGPRSCIGQRFALTESICVLATMVRKYEILLPEDMMSKSLEEQKRILLYWIPGVTITPTNARVRLRLRT